MRTLSQDPVFQCYKPLPGLTTPYAIEYRLYADTLEECLKKHRGTQNVTQRVTAALSLRSEWPAFYLGAELIEAYLELMSPQERETQEEMG